MNIAIMFNGQFRWFNSFKLTFESNFKPILEGHQVQYFAHFWYYGIEYPGDFFDICQPMIIEKELSKTSQEIKEYLGYKKDINGTLPFQLYTAYKVFLLLDKYQKDNNTMFDLYIRMRPDIMFPEKINFNFDENSVYTKKCHTDINFVCDFAYFTKSFETVKKMAEFGKTLDEAVGNINSLLYNEIINGELLTCPEEILANYIKKMKLPNKLHTFNLDLARHYKD